MANIRDSMTAASYDKMMDIIRQLLDFFKNLKMEHNTKVLTNLQLETYEHFINLLEKYEKQKTENPQSFDGSGPIVTMSFHPLAKREIQIALQQSGIKYYMTADSKNEPQIIIDNDPKIIEAVKAIRMSVYKQLSVSPQLTKNDLYKENSGKNIILFEDFTSTQVDEFRRFAQKNEFFFAAQENEFGKYTIFVSQTDAEQPQLGIQKKLNEIYSYGKYGLQSEYANIHAQKKAAIIDETIQSLQQGGTSIPEKTYFIDTQNPQHYVIINGKSITVHNENGGRIISGDGIVEKIYNELSSMTDCVKVSATEFAAICNGQDITNETALIQFAKDSYNISEQKINIMLFESIQKISQTQGVDFDVQQTLVDKMISVLGKTKNPQEKKLLQELKTNPPTKEQLQQMLKTGDSLRSGCTSDITLAKQFNRTFDVAMANIVTDHITAEALTMNTIKVLQEQGKINIRNISPAEIDMIVNTLGFKDESQKAIATGYIQNLSQSYKAIPQPIIERVTINSETKTLDDILNEQEYGYFDGPTNDEHSQLL